MAASLPLVPGTFGGFSMARFRFPGRMLFGVALLAPLVVPEVILGLSLLLLFVGCESWLGWAHRSVLTITIAHATFGACFVSVLVRAQLASFDRTLEEVALDLGARPLTVLTRAFRLPRRRPHQAARTARASAAVPACRCHYGCRRRRAFLRKDAVAARGTGRYRAWSRRLRPARARRGRRRCGLYTPPLRPTPVLHRAARYPVPRPPPIATRGRLPRAPPPRRTGAALCDWRSGPRCRRRGFVHCHPCVNPGPSRRPARRGAR